MARIRILLLLLCFSAVFCRGGEEPIIWMGMTREQVQDTLGYPEALATAGKRSILFFKDGARFEFENEILISVRGYKGQIEFSPVPAGKERTAAVSMTPKPVAAPALSPALKQKTDTVGPDKKRPLERQDGLPTYDNVTKPAVTALEQVARFFYAIFDPVIFDSKQRLQPLGLPILAGLIRMTMTFFALRMAIRRSDHELGFGDLALLSSLEWGLRVVVATIGVFSMHGGFPAFASELATTFLFWILVARRPELHGLWLSLRIALFTKLAVLAVSFVLFMILLNLSA
ncbi:MAG: hypothetical protein WC378_02390 [Opitutaceae bacterium]|jgi:hypothetical protein